MCSSPTLATMHFAEHDLSVWTMPIRAWCDKDQVAQEMNMVSMCHECDAVQGCQVSLVHGAIQCKVYHSENLLSSSVVDGYDVSKFVHFVVSADDTAARDAFFLLDLKSAKRANVLML